jgi:hypothetical protein
MLGLSAKHPELQLHFSTCLRDATSYLMLITRDFIKGFPEAERFTDERFHHLERLWTDICRADMSKV